MDQDVGVQLVDLNPDDIEILQILASGSSTTIHRYTSYDINGYTFYTRAQDNKKINQNNSVSLSMDHCLKVPLFRYQWTRFSNRVKTDKYGITNVNFSVTENNHLFLPKMSHKSSM
jgi:hypothetical protein